jgi:hypothetical protein
LDCRHALSANVVAHTLKWITAKKMKKTFLIVLSTGAITTFVIVNIQRHYDQVSVLNDHSYTLGKIVSYNKVGVHRNKTLKYSYEVNGRTYARTIAPEVDFPNCEGGNIKFCESKRFIVMFSNKDHSKSLINLKNELEIYQKVEQPEKPDNFE